MLVLVFFALFVYRWSLSFTMETAEQTGANDVPSTWQSVLSVAGLVVE